MIIRISILLVFAALAVLVSTTLMLELALPVFPEQATRAGLMLLFSGFALLFASGLLFISKVIIRVCFDYFSSGQRLQRKLLFTQTRQSQLRQLFYFKTVYVTYFNNLQRQRLLVTNNRKHIRLLSKTIDRDLISIKQRIPRSTYLQLQKENGLYRNQQDAGALLKLQQKIEALD